MNESEESLYAQLDRLEQSLDSELNELQAFLQNSQAQEISNEAQESIDIETDDCLSKNNEFFKTESGYNQTCIVKTTTAIDYHGETASRQAFYRCGKHCYQGEVTLDLQHAFDTTLDDISVILSMLQQQQSGFLSFRCDSENDLHEANGFYGPLQELEKAQNFLVSEVSSDGLSADIEKLDDKWQLYFELVGDTSCLFQDVLFACSRVHSKGLTFIHLYFEGVLYAAIQDHDLGEQPLLDVMFSAYFRGGNEGSTLAMYNNTTWMKLSAWKRAQRRDAKVCLQHFPKSESEQEPNSNAQDLVSNGYVQSYYILKPDNQGKEREVMFRFGAWLYSGRVDLPSTNSLQEIPCVIREMRLAQHKLEFVGDTSSLPASNKFIKPMLYSTHITKCMEEEAASCEVYLRQIMTEAQVDADQEDKHWLELDENKCFFEFACGNDASSPASETLNSVELVCNKVYNANNVITISIYHAGTWYLVLEETGGENPLLDSKFPDLSSKKEWMPAKDLSSRPEELGRIEEFICLASRNATCV